MLHCEEGMVVVIYAVLPSAGHILDVCTKVRIYTIL